ncbi:hypothetical protein L1887_31872 [Cichorium endivia]|nr:hypothetical protein L1887_31872 [Cichorium endivia]
MSTSPSLPTTTESKEDAEYNKICQEYKHLIKTIPNSKGWSGQTLYNYNCFWLTPTILKSNLLLHTYFRSQPTDIVLASVMKSGTTWLKALMFSTLNRHRYSFSDHPLLRHGPHSMLSFMDYESYPITDFTHIPAPRLFSTHFSLSLLPPCMTSCKFVYICREPKDVFISNWHYMNKLRSKDLPPLSLDKAFDLFCQGMTAYGPSWEHVLQYWRASLESPDKILFLKYEEVKKQPEVVLRELAAFMGKPFTAEEVEKGVVESIVNLCSFENLSNLEVNKNGVEKIGKVDKMVLENRHFFRKGEIGDWENYLSEEMKQRIDGITHEKLKGSGLIFGER